MSDNCITVIKSRIAHLVEIKYGFERNHLDREASLCETVIGELQYLLDILNEGVE